MIEPWRFECAGTRGGILKHSSAMTQPFCGWGHSDLLWCLASGSNQKILSLNWRWFHDCFRRPVETQPSIVSRLLQITPTRHSGTPPDSVLQPSKWILTHCLRNPGLDDPGYITNLQFWLVNRKLFPICYWEIPVPTVKPVQCFCFLYKLYCHSFNLTSCYMWIYPWILFLHKHDWEYVGSTELQLGYPKCKILFSVRTAELFCVCKTPFVIYEQNIEPQWSIKQVLSTFNPM